MFEKIAFSFFFCFLLCALFPLRLGTLTFCLDGGKKPMKRSRVLGSELSAGWSENLIRLRDPEEGLESDIPRPRRHGWKTRASTLGRSA
ncbi:hypothetical protein MGYG_08073 [Nannizzia gypsea CBS 118893]|uniref:Secreted protein n=1 Tax=Arthroderma gypseum (strain ATCC MYA-4604 / CBS 118893) TaxID=535722 RepID=E4V4Z2_ARTGP|nr:hypothetical protein MGYG_08073 [Nannizzia gypsea CBS 118893]EFR05066.1 hypothetical protein MGYG_08073 [Nannizzia gypsea CBS 118893]